MNTRVGEFRVRIDRALSADAHRAAKADGYKNGRLHSDFAYDDAREAWSILLAKHNGEVTDVQKATFMDAESTRAARELKAEMDADVDRKPDTREILPHLLGDELGSHEDTRELIGVYIEAWQRGFRKRLEEALVNDPDDYARSPRLRIAKAPRSKADAEFWWGEIAEPSDVGHGNDMIDRESDGTPIVLRHVPVNKHNVRSGYYVAVKYGEGGAKPVAGPFKTRAAAILDARG